MLKPWLVGNAGSERIMPPPGRRHAIFKAERSAKAEMRARARKGRIFRDCLKEKQSEGNEGGKDNTTNASLPVLS